MILGVDLGTSVMKAASFSLDGEALEVEGRRVKLYNPRPECSEQDIGETLDALGDAVRSIVTRVDELVDAVGLTGQGFGPEAYEYLLAPIDPSPGPMRPLNAEGAKLLSLPEETPVHNGPFDLPATALGAGVKKLGDGLIIVGTTLACEVVTDHVDTSDEPGGQAIRAMEPDRWMRAMPAMVGTASMDLTLSLLGSGHSEIEGFLAESPPGARGVYVLPFFSPSGERTPFVEPGARGQPSGMTLGTSRADVVRAVTESVGYAARHCLREAGLGGEITICGGGTESSAWRQVLADVLQRPLKIARRPEVGARGAAMAAMISAGTDFDRSGWA